MKIVKYTIMACAAAVFSATALAQDAVEIEPLAGTGDPMRDAERRVLSPVPRDVSQEPEVEVATEPPAPELPESVEARVIGPVDTVRILGSTEFATREGVAARVREALGDDGDKTVGDITAALTSVRQDLLKKGFYLVRLSLAREGAYDPATKTLSVVVDEGRFGDINITFGDEDEEGTWFSHDQILKRFKAIETGDTFDYSRLRGALFKANSHPDLTIDTAISVRKPIEGEGSEQRVARYADLNLSVRESIPVHLLWEVDNYGLPDVNEWQSSLTVQYMNLTKNDDVLTISPAMSARAEMLSLAASYLMPHEWWLGGNTTLYGGWSRVDIDDIIPELDLEGTGYFVGLQHSENLYDDDNHLVALSAGVLWRYIEDHYTVAGRSLRERGAHILPLTLALSYTGKKADFLGGRNFATVQGILNVLTAGDELKEMWNEAEENYWIFRWQVARLQPLFGWMDEATGQALHNWQLFLRLEGQYTSDTLIPTEKLMLGGYNCLRGYRTRGYVGDYGVYGTVELRTPLLVDGFASLFGDRTDKVAFDRLQFLAFCDWGIAQYNDLPSGFDDNEFLLSAGVGARLAVTKHTQLKCDLAFPCVDGNNEKDNDYEIYFAAQVQF